MFRRARSWLTSTWDRAMGNLPLTLDHGVGVVAKAATTTSVTLWVAAYLEPEAEPKVEVLVASDADTQPRTVHLKRYHTGKPESDGHFYHAHELFDGLAPGTEYRVSVACGSLRADCQFRTLPAGVVGSGIRMLVASCYHREKDQSAAVAGAFNRLLGEDGRITDLNIWCGDQVYLDAPWREFRRHTRSNPRPYYLQKYNDAWGLLNRPSEGQRPNQVGLAPLLTRGSNWFLPDDHEFWNNFPHATPLALYSYKNKAKIVRDRADRLVGRCVKRRDEALLSPPSRDEWEDWSRAAFELFSSFQTPSAADCKVSGGAGDADELPLRTPLLQHVDIGEDVRVVWLDSRTQRTRNADKEGASFVPKDCLDQLFKLAATDHLFVLVAAQPLLVPPVKYKGIGRMNRLNFDRSLQHYREQYPKLWRGLVEARRGRPMIVLGGDVHQSHVATARPETSATAASIVEVVSSPLTLVEGLEPVHRAKTLWKDLRRGGQSSVPRTKMVDVLPEIGRFEVRIHAESESNGLSVLDLTRGQGDEGYRLRVRFLPHDASAGYDVTIPVPRGSSPAQDFPEVGAGSQ